MFKTDFKVLCVPFSFTFPDFTDWRIKRRLNFLCFIFLRLGAIQIIRDTFSALFWTPGAVWHLFFHNLSLLSLVVLWTVKWSAQKVYFKALSCFQTKFLLQKKQKSFCDTLYCDVLFEWPLILINDKGGKGV
jgi:hypothetical protein